MTTEELEGCGCGDELTAPVASMAAMHSPKLPSPKRTAYALFNAVSGFLGGEYEYVAPPPHAEVAVAASVEKAPDSAEVDLVYEVSVGILPRVRRRYAHFVRRPAFLHTHARETPHSGAGTRRSSSTRGCAPRPSRSARRFRRRRRGRRTGASRARSRADSGGARRRI